MNWLKLVLAAAIPMSCSSGQREMLGEPERHLLPDGFTGAVLVVFDDPKGQQAEYLDGERVYRIPASGVLRTRFRSQYGFFPARYYHARHDTVVRELTVLEESALAETKSGNHVFEIEPGTISRLEHQGSVSKTIGREVHFRTYVVGSIANAESLTALAHSLLAREIPR